MQPLLGWIPPDERTQAQHDAHATAQGVMVKFALPVPKLRAGESIRLFDAWKHPLVVGDVGFKFDRIHQLTGSCVWAGGTNALFSTIANQRLVQTGPTKAFLPFTLQNYAMSRHYMGDDGQGEGSLGSTFAKSLTVDGVRDWPNDGSLPKYSDEDGISVGSESVEKTWSSYRNPALQTVLTASRQHLLGQALPVSSVQDIQSLLARGIGVAFACTNYIGKAAIRGEGDKARVMGKWDGRGGHQQSIHAYEMHPDFGPIYWAQNNWPRSVYPQDPAGGPVCGCWVLEADVETALGYQAEVYGYSHIPWELAVPIWDGDWTA